MVSVHFSSKTDNWATPPGFAERYGPFDLDPAADAANARAPQFYTREQDGLAQPWHGRVWLNPPYVREIGKWVAKAVAEIQRGGAECVVCLLPARTDTAWFHQYVTQANRIEFLRGRLKFGGSVNAAPFPSMVVIFERAFDATQAPIQSFTLGDKIGGSRDAAIARCGKFTELNSKGGIFTLCKQVR